MDYPTYPSQPGRVYSIPDSRLARVGFSGNRPSSLVQPGHPITPVNMLPYQMAAQVPYGYTLQPIMQQGVIPPQRLMYIQPGSRNVYNVVDIDEEDGEYVPFKPPQKRVSQWLEELTDTPEMEDLESKTRQIRRDADAALKRISSLGRSSSRPTPKVETASDYFKNYDYSRIYRPIENEPRPSRSSYLERAEEDEDVEPSPYTRRSFRTIGRTIEVPAPTLSSVKDRINSVYNSIEAEPTSYVKTPKTYDFVHATRLRDPSEKVKSEINRKAMLLEPGNIGRKGSVKRESTYRDPDEVRNNINFRAQYAAMREAAKKDYKKNNDYLLP